MIEYSCNEKKRDCKNSWLVMVCEAWCMRAITMCRCCSGKLPRFHLLSVKLQSRRLCKLLDGINKRGQKLWKASRPPLIMIVMIANRMNQVIIIIIFLLNFFGFNVDELARTCNYSTNFFLIRCKSRSGLRCNTNLILFRYI